MISDDASMADVFSTSVQEPAHRLLVVLVVLALDDNLLEAVDELVTALGREVLVAQEATGTLLMIISLVAMFRRHAPEDIVLHVRI